MGGEILGNSPPPSHSMEVELAARAYYPLKPQPSIPATTIAASEVLYGVGEPYEASVQLLLLIESPPTPLYERGFSF